MKNAQQITLLVSVPVTVTYDAACGLDEEFISNKVVSEIKRTLVDHAEFFTRYDDVVTVNEFSVRVNDIMPTGFKYN